MADQARKDKGVTGVTWGAPAEWPERGRAQTGEEIIDRLQRAVDIIGEPNAAKKLNDVLTLNQGDIVNAFRAPGGAPGIPEITDRITELAYKVEDTGDPGAAKELSSFIQSNIGALKGFPRWPVARITPEAPIGTSATAAEVIAAAPEAAPIPGAPRPSGADMVTRPAAPVALAGRSNVTPTPPEAVALSESPAPKATPPLEPPSSAPARAGGGGTVGLSALPAGEKPVAAPAEEKIPAAPMGTSGSAAENIVAPVIPEVTPAPTLAPGEIAPPEALHALGAAKRQPVYDVSKALERYDRGSVIKAYGGFSSRADILKGFEPEERRLLFPYTRKGAQGPDALLQELQGVYPEHFGEFKTDAELIMALIKGELKAKDRDFIKEYNDEAIARAAKEEGLDEASLSEAQATAEREIAFERDAIAGEGRPEDYDLTWPKYSISEAAFGLKPKERPVSKLETRLDELAAEYPDIDRDKAATVLRALPEAENHHVAAMSADPEMFARVARGNLAASERAQLFKRATDLGTQMGLPGMRGDTLFRAGEEAAFTRGLTTEQIGKRLGDFGTVSEIAPESLTDKYARGWKINLKNRQMVSVFEAKDGSLKIAPGESLGPEYAALGITEGTALGKFTPMNFGGMIELAKGLGPRTFDHEAWHMIERWVLTDAERAKISKKFGDNEELRAEAYANWNPKATPDTVFQKILDFFKDIAKALTGYKSAEDIFAKARSGELFGREPVERRLPEALAPAKYRAVPEAITVSLKETKEAVETRYRGIMDTLSRTFASGRTSEEARRGHGTIVGAQAEKHAEIVKMGRELRALDPHTSFDSPDTIEFCRLFQSGEDYSHMSPELRALGDFVKREDQRQMRTMANYGKAPQELKNHLDQLWAPSEILTKVHEAILNGTPMKGPDYFFNARTIPNIPTGIAMGLTPRFPTLAQQVLAGRSARESFIAGQKMVTELKGRDESKPVKSLRDTPEGWKRYPGAYGEIWTKVDRPGGLMVPREADELTMPLGGGPERIGYEQVQGVKGWMRTGFRVGPEDVVRQFENFAGKGLKGNDIFEIYQNSLYAVRHLQMALSGWHFFFEGINSMADRSWSGLADAVGGLFTGDIRRAVGGLGQIVTAPAALPLNIRQGLKFDKALMDPNHPDHAIAKELVAGGVRVAADVNLGRIIAKNFRAAWEAGPLHPLTATSKFLQGMSSALMDYVVPQGKNGSTWFQYLNEVKRFERSQGREPDMNERKRIAYEVREKSDAVWGAVAADNVAMNDTAKSLLGAVIQFPRFNIGSVQVGYRAIKGAENFLLKAVDFARGKPVRTLEMKDRLALQYAAGLLFSVGMMGGLMHWAFTGKPPEKMADYFYPRTGETMPNGAEERLQLPSYLKDAMGLYKHPFRTISAKEATFIHIISDLIENKNYWGEQISDPHDWTGQRAVDIAKYIGKSTMPFMIQTFQQGQKQTLGRGVLSFMGIRPVPREIANTPAQNVIDEYNQMMRATVTTKESAEKKKLKADLMKMARSQDEAGFEEAANKAVSEGNMTRQQVKEIVSESQAPPGMSRFTRLPLEWALRAWDVASGYEQDQWQPYLLKKVMAEKPENLIKNREAVVSTLQDMGLSEAANAVSGLIMPEGGAGVDLTGLGVTKEAPEMGGMGAVDDAIAAALEMKLADKTKPKKPTGRLTTKEKKRPYAVLGM